jgi:molybdopterin molybdotransferase
VGDLIAVDEALKRILDRVTVLPAENVPIARALGRVLAAKVVARFDIPPFANSGMDGYAVRAADTATASPAAPVTLSVTADIPAGMAPNRSVGIREAARIMTGAPLPPGADAVVPVENTADRWASDGSAPLPDQVSILHPTRPGDNIRPAGEDIRAGQTVLTAGTVLRPQEIGVLVSLGQANIPVFRQPRVAILSTGDELVEIGEPLTPGKIHNSNSYVLAGLVSTLGGLAFQLPPARDTLDSVRQRFQEALALQPDLILSSAGVSVGTRDVVRAVVEELGQVELWRVNVRPGKPLAFGHVRDVPFFGLPGNPVSAMVTFDLFVRPTLLKLAGGDPSAVEIATAMVGESLETDGRRTYLRVKLSEENGELVARSTGTQSSGALLSMVLADGLLIIPDGMRAVQAGSRLQVRLLRPLKRLP